jgi:cell division protein FtsB
MLEKIKTLVVQYAKSLTDVRVIGQTVFVIIVLMVSWSAVKSIQTNYELQKKIVRLQQEIRVQELENQNLSLQNQFLETDQFLELAVRRQFGKAAEGERVYLVPSEVALKYAPKLPQEEQVESKVSDKAFYQENLEAWVDFFFRKSDNPLLNT